MYGWSYFQCKGNCLVHVKINDIEFTSPLLTASGTYGYGHEVQDMVDVNQWGGIITKSVTRYPREGNPPPRIAETNCHHSYRNQFALACMDGPIFNAKRIVSCM